MSKKNWLRILMVFVCLMLVCTCVPAEECTHPEGRQQVMYSDWESATFMNNDDGRTHTATYVNPFEMIKCMDCQLEYRNDLTMDPVVEPHGFARGVCGCGALEEDTNCVHTASDYDHANSTYAHEGALDSKEYVSLGAEEHQVSYTPLDVYVCPTCGCTYDRVGEYKTVTEAHRFKDGVCRYCQEPAAAAEYTLTYTFENHPFGIDMYTTPVMSGTVVTLDVPLGEVAENQETGDMARMKSWTEDVPMGATAVQFSTSEDDWGNTAYSFTMPARNVIVHGVWETVYSVVYVDNAWYCDDKFEDEWHFAAYGEPTPLYNGGVDPYHEGYWFAGWKPEIAETVTENARYAAWFGLNGEDCAHFDFHCISEYETRLSEGEQWMPNGMGKHFAYVWSGAVYACDECGKELLDGSESFRMNDCFDGEDEDVLCDTCGAELNGCTHEDKSYVRPAHRLQPGTGWRTDNCGSHFGMGVVCHQYTCNTCGETCFAVMGEFKEIPEHCYSEDGDEWCDTCGALYCQHKYEDTELRLEYPGEYTDNGDGTCSMWGREYEGLDCYVCNRFIGVYRHSDYRTYTFEHEYDEEGNCIRCGAQSNGCDHLNAEPTGETEETNQGWENRSVDTHTRWYYIASSFYCPDCETEFKVIGDERYYIVEPHTEKNGLCVICGGVLDCAHASKTLQMQNVFYAYPNTEWSSTDQGQHERYGVVYDVYYCSDCDQTVREALGEPGLVVYDCCDDDEDGVCDTCGWVICWHENRGESEIRYEAVDGWYSEGWGYHYGNAVQYNVFYCNDCEHEIREALGEAQWVSKEDCYSNDGDIWCDACGWPACAHENREAKDEYVQWDGDACYIGSNEHAVMARNGREYYCPDCDTYLFDAYENFREYIYQCWDSDDEDTQCDECGADYCAHENLTVKNDNHHQPVNGENWQHVGWGHHGANCRVGVWGHCQDCGEDVALLTPDYQEYRVEQCWEGDTQNNTCDGCGCEFDGNWGTCNHEGEQEYFNHYSVNDDGWVDNGNGTHTGMAIEVWGFNCKDCGNFFGRPTHDDERLYTVPHSRNSDNNTCWDCGVSVAACWHDPHIRTGETLVKDTHYMDNDDGTHMRFDRLLDLCICQVEGCGAQFYLDGDEIMTTEGHAFNEDGWCVCGAKNCAHEGMRLEEPDMIRLNWNTGWECTGHNTHIGTGVKYDRYYCDACQHTVLVPVNGTGETEVFEIACFSRDDGDNWCDDCGWYFACENHDPQVINPEHYELRDGEDWHFIGDGQHKGQCDKGTWYHCYGCNQGWFANAYEFDVEFIGDCWDENGDESCDACGAYVAPCPHHYTSDWHTGYDWVSEWTDNENGTHSFNGYELWGFDCYDCGQFIGDRRHDDEREYTFVHSYDENGNCGCGAVYSGCDHENATFNRKGKNYNTVVEDLFNGKHVRWFDVYHEYTCDACGAIFMRYVERGEEVEEHEFHNGECVTCGAPECEHEGMNLVRENVILLEPGRNWNWSTHGSHTGYGVKGDIYYCEACNHDVYERYENQEPQYLTEDCFDGDDEDNRCDVCGWVFCEHGNMELEEAGFHYCLNDEGWYYAGDYKHSAVCEVGDWYFCHDCGEYVFDKKVDAQLYTYSCWDDNFDGNCDTCGAESCRHEDIEVKNERHYQPARGHQWQHVGWTHHAAECDVGITFYCNDCGAEGFRRDYREYITERCWEGDNKDNVCDGCGEGFGENWGDCEHNSENNYYYNHYELKDGEQWVINDNGTHSGWAIEVWGFHCELCGNHVATRNHDDYRWYTVPHSFNEENNTCHDCGAAVPDCHHEHGKPTGEKEILYAEYYNNDDGTHMVVARLLDEFKCQDCGETFLRDEGSNAEYSEEHTYENGECIHCAYPQCDHSDLSKLKLEEEGMIRPIWGTDWRADNREFHTCVGVKYDRYTCKECGWAWLVPVNGTGEKEFFEEKCYDDNDDNHCDVCGWYFCEHDHVDVKNNEHYEPVPGAHWEYAGNGHHTALCDKGYWEYCYDCDREYFVDPYEFNVIGYDQCHDHDGDGSCDDCGAWAECEHEDNTSNWYSEHHCDEWIDNFNGTHTGWGYEVRGYFCYECDQFIGYRTHEEKREYIFEHLFDGENGTCGACGAPQDCMHENATFNEDGEQKNTTFENLLDGTHARWFDLYHEYTCNDCKRVFLRYMGRVYEHEEHRYGEDGFCACGAKQCEHANLDSHVNYGVIYPMPGYEWQGEGQGYHWVEKGAVYDCYYCNDCKSEVRVFVEGTGVQENLQQPCYDNDNNDFCDVCDYPIGCTHENKEPGEVCHWWKRGEVPVYIGNYQHEVLAHEGREYYCPDCDELIFEAYEDFKLYQFNCHDGNDNGWCDHCNAEMCRHEGNTSPWRNEYHCDWEYYDENLHHGWGYEMHGFECYDCGEFVCDPTHEEEREFFEQHYYNEETGRCWQCDAELTCSHEHGATRNDEAEDVKLNEVYENLFDGTHARWFDRFHEYTCRSCGENVLLNEGRYCEIEEHFGNNEVACGCGWYGCKHENTEPGEQGIVRPLPGYSFHGEGMGYHWTEKGAVYNISYCIDCKQPVFEIVGEVQDNIRENCFDGDDENDECDVCGWTTTCAHPNRDPQGECHWWIENAEPEHIGSGLHEVLAHFGMEYWCPDCESRFFDAYEGYKLYAFSCEDRDGDGRCDDCRVEMTCEHNGDGKEWREDMVTGPWTDNGDGTHSAEGYKLWGFDCDCGEFIGHPMDDDKMVFTYEHYFEDGECHCGAKQPECGHENWSPIDGGDFFNKVYENLYNGTHNYTFDVYEWTHCNECGEDFLRYLVTEEKVEEHDFSEGDCPCGAIECDHAETTLVEADEFHQIGGWAGDGLGHHSGKGTYKDRYNCDSCRKTVLVAVSDEMIVTNDCADKDGDGYCDECGYKFCDHENAEWVDNQNYEPAPGEEWTYIGDGWHSALCNLARSKYCPDCEQYTYEYYDYGIEHKERCTDWDESGRCDCCGAEVGPCDHGDAEMINGEYYDPAEGQKWEATGSGSHKAVCDVGLHYFCHRCEDEWLEVYKTGVVRYEACFDDNEDGLCDACGDTLCPHEHTGEWELRYVGKYVNNYDGTCTTVNGVEVDGFDCYDCGKFVSTPSHDGYRTYTFEHDFADGVCVRCGAQAGDCMHENAQMTDDPAEHVNLWIGDWHEGTHIVWYDTMTTWNCPACGETFKRVADGEDRTFKFEEHNFVDGVCDACGAIECAHENKQEKGETFILDMDAEWIATGNGTHKGNGTKYIVYTCSDCQALVYELQWKGYTEVDCWDDDYDDCCDACGAEMIECVHPQERMVMVGWQAETETFEDNGDGRTHKATYTNLRETWRCLSCGREQEFFAEIEKITENHSFVGGECACGAKDTACAHEHAEKDHEVKLGELCVYRDEMMHVHSYIPLEVFFCPDCGCMFDIARERVNVMEAHEFDEDGNCRWCVNECSHPEDSVIQTGWDFASESFADNGDGRTHEATYTGLYESFRCLICNETWEYTAETETRTESHAFTGGECACGALDNACAHEHAQKSHEAKKDESCVWLNETEHEHRYVQWDVFFCPDCECWFDEEIDLIRKVEEHEFDAEGNCLYCVKECPHENAIADENLITDTHYQIDNQSDYVANQTGCHIVHAVKGALYDCPDCEESVFVPYGEAQGYYFECLDENGDLVCDLCGWEFPDCDHENRSEEYSIYSGEFEDNGDGTHSGYGTELKGFWCEACDSYIAKPTHEGLVYYENIPHSYDENGECYDCTAVCEHPNIEVTDETFHMPVDGTEWKPAEGKPGWHTAVCEVGYSWDCPDCGYWYFEKKVEAQQYTSRCHDNDEDGVCEACGAVYVPCVHENRTENFYHYDGEFENLGNGKHGGYAIKMYGFWCEDCDDYIADRLDEEPQYYELYHEFNEDGVCDADGCGATNDQCVHPEEKREVFDWFNEGFEFTDNGDGKTHKSVYSDVTEVWDCAACGRRGQSAADDKIFEAEPHAFTGGVCECGAEDTFCEHTNRVWQHEGRKNAEYTYYDKTNHKSSYIALDVYECQDCGCWFDIEAGQKVILEEHMLKGETECAYCGEFGDIYKLSFQFVGEDAGKGYSRNVKAGDVAKLPILVGEVFENEGNPKRFKSWTENVPDGAEPVQFIIAEPNEWGAREYSFTMPERDVTVIGEWEKVYAVVYHDGVDDVEIFADEWHTCSYGEATPAFNGGVNPVREGYVFKGWDPAVAETVTERADYYAQWEICEHTGEYELTGNTEASGYRGWAEQIAGNDYKHTALYAKHHEAKCLACGALFSHVYEEGAEEADHVYDADGKCTQCAYACSHADKTNGVCDACGTEIACEHQKKTEVETGVYKLAPDSQWTPDNERHHVGMAQIGTLYHCDECNSNLFVPLEDVKEYRFECKQDANEDGKCDVCQGDIKKPFFKSVKLDPPTCIVGSVVTLQGEFGDETELGRYEVLINDVVKASGKLSGMEDAIDLTFTDLEVGEYYFKLVVYDARSNFVKYPFPVVTITPANTAPVVGDITSTAGETFHIGTEVTFSADVTDDYGLTKVELYIDNEIKASVETGDLQSAIEFATSELTVGEHVVRVVATDSDNLTAEKSLTVTVYCDHVSKTPTGSHEEKLIKRESLDDYEHKDYVIFYEEMQCPDCGEVFIEEISQEFEDGHAYVDGKCTECEHECGHPKWMDGACDACDVTCKHESWTNGDCNVCDVICEHEKWTNGDCDVCDVICEHESWTNGDCNVCDVICEHEKWTDGDCDVCDVICGHEDKTWTGNTDDTLRYRESIDDYQHMEYYTNHDEMKCNTCGKVFIENSDKNAPKDHTYENGKCTECEHECGHPKWIGGACDACDVTCKHESWTNGNCNVCDVICEHEKWTDGDCDVCDVICEHEKWTDGDCDVCDVICGHEDKTWTGNTDDTLRYRESIDDYQHMEYYTNHDEMKCNTCGKVFIENIDKNAPKDHTYENGKCTKCEHECGHPKWIGGACDACDVTCKHESWTNGDCNVCDVICEHEKWTDGACDVCDVICEHEKWTDGDCDVCDVICGHEDKTWTGNTDDTLRHRESIDDYQHMEYYTNHDEMKCNTCGKVFIENIDKNAPKDHTYENGKCTKCEHECGHPKWTDGACDACDVTCSHEDKTWTGNTDDTLRYRESINDYQHMEYYTNHDEMKCNTCGKVFIENLDENAPKDHTYENGKCTGCEHVCQHPAWNGNVCDACKSVCEHKSWNEDGTCAKCGTTCEHPKIRPDEESFTDKVYGEADPIPLEENKAVRNERHLRYYTAMADYYCETCSVFVKKDQVSGYESEAHAFGEDHVCDLCGYEKLHITKQPDNVKVYPGETAKFTVKATGDGLTYQWYFKNPGSSSFSKGGGTEPSSSIKMTEAYDGRQMYCVVTDKYGKTMKSDTATMTMTMKLAITTQPKAAWAYDGENAKVSVTAVGDGLTYQWYYKDVGAENYTKATATSANISVTMNAARNGRQMYCVVTDEHGSTVKSDVVKLSTRFKATITDQPKNMAVVAGETAKFTVKATGDGLTYQWYYKSKGSDTWSKSSTGTTATYSFEMKESYDGRSIRCIVTDAYDNTVTSNTAALTLKTKLAITTQPKNAWAYDGEGAKVSVQATGDGLTYQWYYKDVGAEKYTKASATSANISVTMNAARNGRQMYCVVTDEHGGIVKSDVVKLSTRFKATITDQPDNAKVYLGETATFTVEATGDGLTYQWYYKGEGSSTWNKSSTGTTDTYSFEMKESFDGRSIRCKVTDEYGNTVTSSTATLTLKTKLAITTQPKNAWAYDGENAKVSVTATGDGLKYQWYYKNAGAETYTKSSGTNASLSTTMSADRDGRQVYCEITDEYGNTVKSNAVKLSTRFKATITSQPNDAKVALGNTAKFTVKATGDGLTYQWYYKGEGSSTWNKSSTGTTDTYSFEMKESFDGRSIRCKVTDEYGNTVTSSTADLQLKPTYAEITSQPKDVKVAAGETAKFTVSAKGDGLTYQWYYKSEGSSTWSKSSTGTTNTYSFAMKVSFANRSIRCKVTDKYGNTVTSSTVDLKLDPTYAEITSQPADKTVAAGSTAKFTVAAKGDSLTYQWYYKSAGADSWTKSSTGTSATYSFTMKESYDGRSIRCKVTDMYGNTKTSSTADLKLKPTYAEITTQPKSATVAAGEKAKFTVKAKGDGLTYQWYYKKAGSSTWSKSSTGTSATYSFTMKESYDGRSIRCKVTDKYGNTVTSSSVKLTLD